MEKGLCALTMSALAVSAQTLPRQEPSELGVDAAALEAALDNAGGLDNIRSLVVVRAGSVVGERYWVGDASTRHNVHSVTRGVMSLLIGVAVDRGLISSVDEPIADYLPADYLPLDVDKRDITIRHLLTMTSGLEWDENDDWFAWSLSSDPVRFILSRPLTSAPGERFNHSTAACHLLSAILQEATGTDVLDFAESTVFNRLGIHDAIWQKDPTGLRYGGHGLMLRTEDSARLGLLMLGNGTWEGHRLVAAKWIRQSSGEKSRSAIARKRFSALGHDDLREHQNELGYETRWARGWGGQLILCIPDLQLVVAANHAWNVSYDRADSQEHALLRLVIDQIIPAVTGEDPPWRVPENRDDRANAGSLLDGSARRRNLQ